MWLIAPSSPSVRAAFPDLHGDIERIVTALDREPAAVTIDRIGGDQQTVPFHRGDLAYAVRGALYNPRRVADLPAEIHHAAETANYSYFAQALYGRSAAILGEALSLGLHLSVYCREDVPRLSDVDALAATAGTLLGDYLMRQYQAGCDAWPVEPAPMDWYRPFSSDIPVLLLSGRYDPTTPDAAAELARKSFPNSAHLVVGDAGHGAGAGCAREVVEDFLVTTNLPDDEAICRDQRIEFATGSR